MSQSNPTSKRSALYSFARFLAGIVFGVFFPLRAHQRQRLDRPAPYILVANHTSFLDPLALGWLCRQYEIHFLGKRELAKNRLFAWVLRQLRMIGVARGAMDMAAMRACMQVLREGHVLGIFPEGTRHQPSLMHEVESGVSLLALRSGVPLIPVLLHPKFRLFARTQAWVGEAITYADLTQQAIDKDACDQLSARIAATFQNMLAQTEETR